MRNSVLLALVLLSASAVPARAQEHGARARTDALAELTPEQRRDALAAFDRIVCRCPRENWSRSLAMCLDDCAMPQKRQVIARVQDGWDVDRIVAEQVALYSSKTSADPGVGSDGSLWIALLLAAGAGAAGVVLVRWSRLAAARRARPANSVHASDTETAAVERELSEIE